MLNAECGTSAGETKSGKSTFKPQEFFKDLRDLTEDGLYTFEHKEFGRLRILKKDTDLFFCLKDVGRMLTLANPNDIFNKLKKKYEENGVDTKVLYLRYPLEDDRGCAQDSLMLCENAFYNILFQSEKAIGFKVKLWVTMDILPAIRKHGLYAPEDMAAHFIKRPDALLITMQALKEEQDRRMALEAELEAAQPKLQFAERCLKSEENLLFREFVKVLSDNDFVVGQNNLYKILRQNKCILKDSTEPSQYAMNNGWFVVEQVPYETRGEVKFNHTTKITPRGQEYLIHKLLNDPRYKKFRPRFATNS